MPFGRSLRIEGYIAIRNESGQKPINMAQLTAACEELKYRNI